MSRISKNRWIIASMAHFTLLFAVSQLNHYLVVVHTHIIVSGMIIAYSVIQLSFYQGLLSLIPIALYLDTISPLEFGTSLLMIVSLYCLMYLFRSQFRRETIGTGILISLILNLGMVSAYTIASSSQFGSSSINFGMTFWNLICSSIVLALIHQFYFASINSLLELFGIRLAEEQRSSK